MHSLVWFSVVVVLVSEYFAADLSSSIPHCSIDSPNVANCILNTALKLRSRIRTGINEIGIPTYNPLVLSNFSMAQESEMMNYTFNFWNYTIRGMDNYDFTEIKFDPKTETFQGNIQFDALPIVTGYEINGSFLFIPVRGKGVVRTALGPINATFELTGKTIKRNDVPYYDVKEVKIRLNIDDISLHLDGLFDGDAEKGAMTNVLINQNSKMIVDAATPAIEKVCEKFITRYFKWLTNKYPLYKLFLHS